MQKIYHDSLNYFLLIFKVVVIKWVQMIQLTLISLLPLVHIKRLFSDGHRNSLQSHPQILSCSTMPINSVKFRLITQMD